MKVIDMHCDTVGALFRLRGEGKAGSLRENSGHIDLLRLKESHYLLQNFAMFIPLNRCDAPWEQVCAMYGYYKEELERNQDILAPVLRFGDIAENEAAGRLSSLLTVEEGGVCGGEIEKLRELYRMGVRMITLTWNFPNEIGQPNFDPGLRRKLDEAVESWQKCDPDTPAWERERQAAQAACNACMHTPNVTGGLTAKGKEFVEEMERLGMIPDVSHLSDAGFMDVLEVTKKPFVASHSNARAICPNVRNLTDDMIRKLSERGGVTGLNFCADFLEEKPMGERNPGSVSAAVRHARHIANVGGIDVLGLGTDFDGIPTHEELPGAQSMEKLWEALRKGGFSERELDQIFYGNVLRVYGDTLG
ncbi:MAG: membrane dipeptidase [Lachnospiraceae bacterium]|nr:membrane dipeptidase [Lachnospiraceae bacterium]